MEALHIYTKYVDVFAYPESQALTKISMKALHIYTRYVDDVFAYLKTHALN